jgi:hypothetical protein
MIQAKSNVIAIWSYYYNGIVALSLIKLNTFHDLKWELACKASLTIYFLVEKSVPCAIRLRVDIMILFDSICQITTKWRIISKCPLYKNFP